MADGDRRLEVRANDGEGLLSRFEWDQDRYQHSIETVGQRAMAWLQSDGRYGESESWPPDPPLQQLSKASLGDHDVVWAVGQAGCGHWSSSVEALLEQQLPTLKLDIACRLPGPAEFLGSQYRLSDAAIECRLEGATAVLSHGDQSLRLTAHVPDASSDSTPVRWTFEPTRGLLRLHVSDPTGERAHTVRWQLSVTRQPVKLCG